MNTSRNEYINHGSQGKFIFNHASLLLHLIRMARIIKLTHIQRRN